MRNMIFTLILLFALTSFCFAEKAKLRVDGDKITGLLIYHTEGGFTLEDNEVEVADFSLITPYNPDTLCFDGQKVVRKTEEEILIIEHNKKIELLKELIINSYINKLVLTQIMIDFPVSSNYFQGRLDNINARILELRNEFIQLINN